MDKELIRLRHKAQLLSSIGALGIAIGFCALTYIWIDAEYKLKECQKDLKVADLALSNCKSYKDDCSNDLHTLEQRIEFTADLVHECEDHIEIYRRSYLRADWKATKPELKKAIRGIICEGSP